MQEKAAQAKLAADAPVAAPLPVAVSSREALRDILEVCLTQMFMYAAQLLDIVRNVDTLDTGALEQVKPFFAAVRLGLSCLVIYIFYWPNGLVLSDVSRRTTCF